MSRRSTGGRIRALIFLILSLVAAVLASVVIYAVIVLYNKQLDDATKPIVLQPVMVAARDVWQGKTIEKEDLTLKDLPPEYIPDSVLKNQDQAIGRVPRERILAQEFIRDERLADPAAGVGLNAIIPRGMRAMSINISDGSSVSGFLNPGNYVDVLVTVDGEEGEEAQTTTLLQAVTVLAVNNRLGGGEGGTVEGRPSVTLAITPDLAEKLTHAVAEGDVTLTLRNDIDVTQVETHGALVSKLLGSEDGEDGGAQRISVKEWRQAIEQSGGSNVTMIMGRDERRESFK